MAGKVLDYDKFFSVGETGKGGEVVKKVTTSTQKPPEFEGINLVLNEFNKSMGLVNSTLNSLGVDKSFLQDKLKEKLGLMKKQPPQTPPPYVENFRTPPQKIGEAETKEVETKTKQDKMEFEKIIKILDLAISLKGEDCTLKEVKEFAEANKNIIDGILK